MLKSPGVGAGSLSVPLSRKVPLEKKITKNSRVGVKPLDAAVVECIFNPLLAVTSEEC